MARKDLARPDLEPIAHAHDRDPVDDPGRATERLRQGDPAGGVKRQPGHAAQNAGLQRPAQRITELQLLDQSQVAVEEGLPAALDAVCFDGWETEHAIE